MGPTKKPESSLGLLNSADSGGGPAALRDLFGTYFDPMTPAVGPTKKPESSFGTYLGPIWTL